MNFTCPHCGNNSFVVQDDNAGRPQAKCSKCEKVTPFAKEQMANSRMEPEENRRLHLK